MKLLSLSLEQFRNYPKLDLNFNSGDPMTYIVGRNAQGKTNILEAIYLLALTRSFRTSAQEDLILWDKDYCRIRGEFEDGGAGAGMGGEPGKAGGGLGKAGTAEKTSLEVFFGIPPHPKKSLKKNNVKTNAENFIGTCKIVFFHPEDLNMLYLGPDLRRRYLDILNLQINKKYYRALRTYKRVMQQRNALLKEIKLGFASVSDLEVWNEQLAEHGSLLIQERAKTIVFLNKYLAKNYQKIAQSSDIAQAFYKCALADESLNSGDPPDHGEIKKIFLAALARAEKTDFQAEATTIGPHRDDLEFTLNGRKLGSHASRGEYRSLLLALKLLELKFFEAHGGEKPLLLLDDVFSELDFHRQKMLLEAIEGHQTIITTTHLDELTEALNGSRSHAVLKKGLHLEVKEGSIKPTA